MNTGVSVNDFVGASLPAPFFQNPGGHGVPPLQICRPYPINDSFSGHIDNKI